MLPRFMGPGAAYLSLTLACAFAAAAHTVEAKIPTLATIRARFIVYLLLDESSRQRNAHVKTTFQTISFSLNRSSSPRADQSPKREPRPSASAGGVSGTLMSGRQEGKLRGLRFANSRGVPEVPHGTSDTESPQALRAISLPASLLAPLNSEAVALGADRA